MLTIPAWLHGSAHTLLGPRFYQLKQPLLGESGNVLPTTQKLNLDQNIYINKIDSTIEEIHWMIFSLVHKPYLVSEND